MRASLALAALLSASPALAQVRAVPDQPASAAAAEKGVVVYLMNETGEQVAVDAPDTVAVTAQDGSRLVLRRNSVEATSLAPGGFARAFYTLDRGAPSPATATPGVAVAAAPPVPQDLPATGAAPERPQEASLFSSRGTAAAFIDRFRPHEPIYGVAGLDDAGAKLQFSIAAKPFAGDGVLSWLTLGYTQTMFWALDRPSGPVRATNYSPEAFLDIPVEPNTVLGIGYRHDSNGEGAASSVNSHRIVARIAHRYPLGRGWTAELAPEAWFFLGSKGVATDLDRYLGYTGLRASIFQEEGLRLALSGRGNPGTGEGGLELFVSYPLARLGIFGISGFGQVFTGSGEALSDYDVDDTHARLGIAFTR